jgi:hypothetical protein
MKPLLPVLAAGGTFAGSAVIGLFIGVLVAQRSEEPLWAVAGLMVGAALGAVSALALLVKAMR